MCFSRANSAVLQHHVDVQPCISILTLPSGGGTDPTSEGLSSTRLPAPTLDVNPRLSLVVLVAYRSEVSMTLLG